MKTIIKVPVSPETKDVEVEFPIIRKRVNNEYATEIFKQTDAEAACKVWINKSGLTSITSIDTTTQSYYTSEWTDATEEEFQELLKKGTENLQSFRK